MNALLKTVLAVSCIFVRNADKGQKLLDTYGIKWGNFCMENINFP